MLSVILIQTNCNIMESPNRFPHSINITVNIIKIEHLNTE